MQTNSGNYPTHETAKHQYQAMPGRTEGSICFLFNNEVPQLNIMVDHRFPYHSLSIQKLPLPLC